MAVRLARAWGRVKRNKVAGGVAGVTVTRFDENREHYLGLLHQKLKDEGIYVGEVIVTGSVRGTAPSAYFAP